MVGTEAKIRKPAITFRFLNPEFCKDHPKEFKTWDSFFKYLLYTWGYTDYNFQVGATIVNPGLYRFMTYAFGMIVTDTEVYKAWLSGKTSKHK